MKGHVQDRSAGKKGPGPRSWRLKFDIGRDDKGKRLVRYETVYGTKRDAQDRLNVILGEIKNQDYVDRSKVTLAEWVKDWIALRTGKVNARTIERYDDLLRLHVLPTLGGRPLQSIKPKDIDALYTGLGTKLAPRTIHHIHVVIGACLKAAARKGGIRSSPVENADAPATDDDEAAQALDADQLTALLGIFRGSPLYPIVATAAFTGARRNEILALRWSDIDLDAKTLRIDRALEETKAHGLRYKEPKTERGKRTIMIDDGLAALLRAERGRYQRVVAGVPDRADVDLSLVKMPAAALIFPSPKGLPDLTKPRDPRGLTKEFIRRARKAGFVGLRFHDLRATHETMLLDQGVPVHVVAARAGHDPAVLLRVYAKRTKKADTSAAAVIGTLSKAILGA